VLVPVLPLSPLLEPLAELGGMLLEPMLPEPLADEFGLVAELSEPLTGPEGEVIPLPLSVAEPLSAAEPLPGLVALFDPMLPAELPTVEPLLPALCAKAAGAKAATDNARPAPTKYVLSRFIERIMLLLGDLPRQGDC
jgi:hypothetical protein